MRRRLMRLRSDRGETLVELLAAIVILSVAGVAILAGLQMTVKASDQNRRQATGGAYVRSFAEAIQRDIDQYGYPTCGSVLGYNESLLDMPADPDDWPDGYRATVESSGEKAPSSWNGGGWAACDNKGIIRVNLKVTTTGDAAHRAEETLTVILRRPCNGNAAAVGDNPC